MQELTKHDVNYFKRAVKNIEAANDALGHMRVAYIGMADSGGREVFSIRPMHFFHIESEKETSCYLKIIHSIFSGAVRKRIYASPCEDSGNGYPLKEMLENGFSENVVSEYVGKIADVVENAITNFVVVLVRGHVLIASKSAGADGPENTVVDHNFITSIICPMSMSGDRLVCEDAVIKDDTNKWVVGAPVCAVTYPAIIDGVPDVGYAMYYTKKSDVDRKDFLEMSIGGGFPLMESTEKEWFRGAVAEVSGGACPFPKAQALNEAVTRYAALHHSDEISKANMEKVMKDAGFSEEEVSSFGEAYENEFEDGDTFSASNIAGGNAVKIADGNFEVRTDSAYAGRITTAMVNGRLCLALPLDSNVLSFDGICTDMGGIINRGGAG